MGQVTMDDMFKVGAQPTTNFVLVTPQGERKDLMWLGTEFTHGYGVDRLWLKNNWLEIPLLMHMAKEAGGDLQLFEKIFYDQVTNASYAKLSVSAKEAILLFEKIYSWVDSPAHIKLMEDLKTRKDYLNPNFREYFAGGRFKNDLTKLLGQLRKATSIDKLFIEIWL